MKRNRRFLAIVTLLICLFSMTLSACTLPVNQNEGDFTYYTVTFDTQGGSQVDSQQVIDGNPVVRPNTPNRDEFDFLGWYKSATGNDAWDFETDRVTANITLYAHWAQTAAPLPEIPEEPIQPTQGTASLVFVLENGTYTVAGVGSETAIVIPAEHNGIAVTKIGQNPTTFSGAFARTDIISIVIPDSIREIGLNAFHNAAHLETVTIGENSALTTIGDNAFSGNSSLRSIYIPSGVTFIGDSAFNNCGSLSVITVASANSRYHSAGGHLVETATNTLLRGSNNGEIPQGVVHIADAAFCRSTISATTIPASVISIGNYAFSDCDNLATITVNEDNTVYSSLNGILYTKSQTEIVVVPQALQGSIVLSDALNSIASMAFDGRSGITATTIPKTVSSIGAMAFRGLTATLNYVGSEEEWNKIEKNSHWQMGATLTIRFDAEQGAQQSGILVVYFSATGNTETVAGYVADSAGGTLVEIVPEVPYTADDLNYGNSNSRSQTERRNNARPAISSATYGAIDIASYDTVFIGYPIWNSYEPMIIRTFVEYYNGLAGKTVYTFSTSGSSGGSTAFNSIKGLCPNADVIENCNITRSGLANARQTIATWIGRLNLNTANQSDNNQQEISKMYITINGNCLEVTLEKNSSVDALVEILKQGDIVYTANDYGGFEKVGNIGHTIVQNNTQINATAGDVILYQGNSICLYYGNNSWSFTKIGRINGYTESQLRTLLCAGSGSVEVTISLERK